jgi:protein-S-isoprenylcysteine O-methyltransferase Ste14
MNSNKLLLSTLRFRENSTEPMPAELLADLRLKCWGMTALAWLLLPMLFVLTSGSWIWWSAWLYCAEILIPMTLFLPWTLKHSPQLLVRRMEHQEQSTVQRRLAAALSVVSIALFVLPGIDHRLHFSRPLPLVTALSHAAVLIGYLGILWVFVSNPWTGRTIRAWPDQKLITTGVYSVVRHPMYAFSLLLFLFTPLALGSVLSLIPAVLLLPILILRIRDEEAFLSRTFPSYGSYVRLVPYRLVPYLW